MPTLFKAAWPKLLALSETLPINPDLGLYIGIVIGINLIVIGVYNLVMCYIYQAKIPFFERYRNSDVNLFNNSETLALGSGLCKMADDSLQNHWHCPVQHFLDQFAFADFRILYGWNAIPKKPIKLADRFHNIMAIRVLRGSGGHDVLLDALSVS